MEKDKALLEIFNKTDEPYIFLLGYGQLFFDATKIPYPHGRDFYDAIYDTEPRKENGYYIPDKAGYESIIGTVLSWLPDALVQYKNHKYTMMSWQYWDDKSERITIMDDNAERVIEVKVH